MSPRTQLCRGQRRKQQQADEVAGPPGGGNLPGQRRGDDAGQFKGKYANRCRSDGGNRGHTTKLVNLALGLQADACNTEPVQETVCQQRFRGIADRDGRRYRQQNGQRSGVIVLEDSQVGEEGAGEDGGPKLPSKAQQQDQGEAGRRPDRAGIARRQCEHQAKSRKQVVRSSSEQQDCQRTQERWHGAVGVSIVMPL